MRIVSVSLVRNEADLLEASASRSGRGGQPKLSTESKNGTAHELQAVQERQALVENQLAILRQSRSWRWTRPPRWAERWRRGRPKSEN